MTDKRLLKKQLLLPVAMLLGIMTLLSPWVRSSQWELVQKRGELVYGTRASLLTYFLSEGEAIGFEYLLLKDFAAQNQLQLTTRVFDNNNDLFAALDAGDIDLAGGHLTITKQRQEKYAFTVPIGQTATDLVTHFDHRNASNLKAFEDKVGVVIENSSYSELLAEQNDFEPQNLTTSNKQSLFELVRLINSKEIDYTLGDSEIINIYQHFIPGIYQTIQVSPLSDTAFLLSARRSDSFKDALDQFINEARAAGQLQDYKDQILVHLPDIDAANTVTFFDKLQSQWPQIKDLVFAAAAKLDFDPALLAAISYQESHWEVDAESFTGVKGLMMLTASAAEDMNVTDRTDPRQSLEGGIRYFRHMKNKIPERITEPDRTLFALAAYNVGFGHLEDARILTQRAGQNPDSWLDVEPFMYKLNNPSMAHELRYGNADGATAVTYVNNIMTYQQLMNWKLNKEQKNAKTLDQIL